MYPYNGEYPFNKQIISDWDSNTTGVYYLFENDLITYIGSAIGAGGIRGRLLQHINEYSFPHVNRFGFKEIIGSDLILSYEKAEIQRIQPGRNKIGRTL